jgi:3-oxoacyl-[acyl-carrier-protein] synthase-3
MNSCVGILGVGLYLPEVVRRNDWWPRDVVARWQLNQHAPPPAGSSSPGVARVLDALAGQAADPFQGAVARHVMPDELTVFDLAEQAARRAISRAGVSAGEIDLLLTNTVVPDALLGNSACQLHYRLGLPRRCFALETEAVAYSFMMQLTLAEAMISSGQARLALLVQACGASRLVDMEDPISPLFGDGATAVIVGRVAEGRGLRASAHYADGQYPNSLVGSVRGGAWFDRDRGVIHIADPAQMRAALLQTADTCKESIDAVLASAGHLASDVDMFAMYQGTPWLRQVVQDYVGLKHARSIDTFARTGYMFAATLPAGLALAEQAGIIAEDDLVMITGGGSGMTFGSTLMRWGA